MKWKIAWNRLVAIVNASGEAAAIAISMATVRGQEHEKMEI
jgi:hypothetical protein